MIGEYKSIVMEEIEASLLSGISLGKTYINVNTISNILKKSDNTYILNLIDGMSFIISEKEHDRLTDKGNREVIKINTI